jgi:two-component system, NarL family, nitrate/nitrite response regulator NarL
MTISVILVDDHPLVLSGLRGLIQSYPEFHVVGEFSDGDEALAAIRQHKPMIAVLDLKIGKGSGLSILDAVVGEALPTRIVLLAALMHDAEIYAAVDRGVHGMLLKDWAPDTLIDCLNAVAAGRRWLPGSLVKGPLQRENVRRRLADDISERLTRREREVALLIVDGLTVKQVANRLVLSEGTVKLHLHAVFQKLGVSKRSDMVVMLSRVRDRIEAREGLPRPGNAASKA